MYSTVIATRLVHRADRFGAERGDADVGGALERREGGAGSDELDCGGFLQHEVGAARAVLGRIAAHLDAGLARRDEEEADAGGVVDRAADACRDDEGVRRRARGDGDLLAAEAPRPAAAVRGRLDVREAVARVPLLVGEDDDLLAFGDVLQARRGGGFVAGLEDARRDQRDCRVGLEDEAAAELLEDDHRLDRAEAEAALRFGNLQAADAELADLVPCVAREAARLDDAAPALEVVAALDPAAHRVAQHFLVVGEVEVHGQLPSTVWATMLRCTSLLPP